MPLFFDFAQVQQTSSVTCSHALMAHAEDEGGAELCDIELLHTTRLSVTFI